MKKLSFTTLLVICYCSFGFGQKTASISYFDTNYFINTTTFELKSELPNSYYYVYKDSLFTQPAYSGKIVNQTRKGLWTWYSSSGLKQRDVPYVNGIIQGEVQSYYPVGQLSSRTSFVNGVRQGITKKYYASGELKLEGSFTNDTPSGTWKYWNSDGTLLKEENF